MVMLEVELCVALSRSFGVCPACPKWGVLGVVPTGAIVGSLAEGGRHHLKTVFMARRQRRGSCPVHRKAFIKFFQWVEWANPRSVSSIPHFVSEAVFCANLCIPMPASPSRSHQHSQLALEMHRSVSNIDYSLYWKHQSPSGYLHRLLAVVLTLVKTAVLGIS